MSIYHMSFHLSYTTAHFAAYGTSSFPCMDRMVLRQTGWVVERFAASTAYITAAAGEHAA